MPHYTEHTINFLCVFLYTFLVPLTLAVPVWLSEAVLIPTGQSCIRLVVVGSILAVICPQGALWAPLLQSVRLALLQSWPVGQKVIAIQICHTQISISIKSVVIKTKNVDVPWSADHHFNLTPSTFCYSMCIPMITQQMSLSNSRCQQTNSICSL